MQVATTRIHVLVPAQCWEASPVQHAQTEPLSNKTTAQLFEASAWEASRARHSPASQLPPRPLLLQLLVPASDAGNVQNHQCMHHCTSFGPHCQSVSTLPSTPPAFHPHHTHGNQAPAPDSGSQPSSQTTASLTCRPGAEPGPPAIPWPPACASAAPPSPAPAPGPAGESGWHSMCKVLTSAARRKCSSSLRVIVLLQG